MSEPKPGDHISKTLIGHKVKKEDGLYTFTISTGSVDRDHDTIDPNGWKLDNYRKNPVVLFGHQSRQPPIGKAAAVDVRSGSLKADVVFAEPGTYDLADTVRGLVDQDILRATSVGFIPLKWVFDEQRGGVDYSEQELYEFSIVPIPSNPEALRAVKGVDLAPLVDWCEMTLDTIKGPGLWVSKDVAEARNIAAGEPVSVTVPDAGEVAPDGAHAAETPGSTPGPATPEPAKTAVPDPGMSKSLRLVKGATTTSMSLTREQITAVVQRTVMIAARAAVRQASGRLED